MTDFQTRTQLLGALGVSDVIEPHKGRHLLRTRGFRLFRSGGGTGTGIVLIIAAIAAIAFIAYSIWLSRKKQWERRAAGENQDHQLAQHQVQVPMHQPTEVIGQPVHPPAEYPYGGGAQPAKGGAFAPTV